MNNVLFFLVNFAGRDAVFDFVLVFRRLVVDSAGGMFSSSILSSFVVNTNDFVDDT